MASTCCSSPCSPPPSYVDLGKTARELFSKGFNEGFVKVDTRTEAGEEKQLEFKTAASFSTVAAARNFGALGVKYKLPNGITLEESWNTDQKLATTIEVKEQLGKGSKVTVESVYQPHVAVLTGQLKTEWLFKDCVKINSELIFASCATPIINTSVVGSYNGWLMGVKSGLDPAKSRMTPVNVALGRHTDNYTLLAFSNGGTEFGSSLYQKVNAKMELGAQCRWMQGDEKPSFDLAMQYKHMKGCTMRAKLSNNANLTLGIEHQIAPDLSLIVSGQLNVQKFQEGGQKFGIGFKYEPTETVPKKKKEKKTEDPLKVEEKKNDPVNEGYPIIKKKASLW